MKKAKASKLEMVKKHLKDDIKDYTEEKKEDVALLKKLPKKKKKK